MRARNSLKGCQELGQASKETAICELKIPLLGPRSPYPLPFGPSIFDEISQKGKIPGPGKIMQNFCPVPLELIFHSQCSLVKAPGCTPPPQTKGWNLRTERFEKTIFFCFKETLIFLQVHWVCFLGVMTHDSNWEDQRIQLRKNRHFWVLIAQCFVIRIFFVPLPMPPWTEIRP